MKSSHLLPLVGPNRWRSNPFATRFVSPGALEWMAAPEDSLVNLAARFQTQHLRRAAIVGPHGSGKSTLLAHLVPLLGEIRWRPGETAADTPTNPRGRSVWLELRRRRLPPLPQIMASRSQWNAGGLLILDGLEQLRTWEYVYVRSMLRLARMGLLATCHRPCRTLPTLIDTTASSLTTRRLIAERLATSEGISPALREQLCDERLIDQLLQEEQGSVREVFMRMYDLVENHMGTHRFPPNHSQLAI